MLHAWSYSVQRTHTTDCSRSSGLAITYSSRRGDTLTHDTERTQIEQICNIKPQNLAGVYEPARARVKGVWHSYFCSQGNLW